jgi:predicted transglutaminase-like cysteine proteinase
MLDLWGWKPVALGRNPTTKWDTCHYARSGVNLPLDLTAINAYVHARVRYQAEAVDEWSPPVITIKRGYGDCEDFALLKRSLYIEAGGDEKACLFLLVWDHIARHEHAILIVSDPADGQWKVLDSHNDLVLPVDAAMDYTPSMAFQAGRCWTFGRAVI